MTPKRKLIRLHRFFGLCLAPLFLAWLVSGAVMLFSPMPRDHARPEQRLGLLPPLDPAGVNIGFAQAWSRSGLPGAFDSMRLETLEQRPAYFCRDGQGGRAVVWADDGQLLPGMNQDMAGRVVSQAWGGQPRLLEALSRPDQWSVGSGGEPRLFPIFKWALDDPQGTQVYVSAVSGEICLSSTARQRFWGWCGAVTHWLYFTPLRADKDFWRQLIMWLCVLGMAQLISGGVLAWQGWRGQGWSPKGRRRRFLWLGPRRGHLFLGLIFGLPCLTWVFSGLLSLGPFQWHHSEPSQRQLAQALAASPAQPQPVPLEPAQAMRDFAQHMKVRQMELLFLGGRPWYLARGQQGRTMLRAADQDRALPQNNLGHGELLAAARGLPLAGQARGQDMLWQADLHLDPRPGKNKFPLLRLRYDDPDQTWVYLSPASGRLVHSCTRAQRMNRWLYRFLHCWDLPALASQPWARETLWLLSLAGGAAMVGQGVFSWARRRGKSRRAARP